ncbi:MAG: prenyltransferase [Acidobacteria bacterium]|nr:MAG: prenyltransferase [Acidobacteriota bacterium]
MQSVSQFQEQVPIKSDTRQNRVRLRPVALPVEHGGWGFSLEPVALGLLVAPSLLGLFLSVTTLAAFLARHPLKIAMSDRQRGRRLLRTPIAERFALLYMTISLVSFLAAIKTAPSYEFLLPLLLASPLALIQLLFDRMSRSRALLPELAGATAMASIAMSIALADGWQSSLAFGLWAILAARAVPSVLYVRARLKRLHRQEASTSKTIVIHVLAIAAASVLAWAKLVPVLSVVALSILLARTVYGFSRYDRQATARLIGFRELGFGAMMVAAVALGHYFNL